ncbi:MAG: hypothetical protein WCT46_00055 [Candidatus Gracilibacteria bacterium]|jgi:hypothetical protein
MSRKLIILAITAVIILGTSYYVLSTHTHDDELLPVMRSIPQGDIVYDSRTAEEACTEYLYDLQKTDYYQDYFCSLYSSERIDSGTATETDLAKCTDGLSIAGCFSCLFECRK